MPSDVLAIIRISQYSNGKPDAIEELVIMEDGQDSYDAFATIVVSALEEGANVSISSGHRPEELGIYAND